ncbi:hypothetical protein [Desulfoferula mesophila]|uniref:Uncharacterized protein n=1 Tax=Desulfoferula mesophila TaxID=3058419 RepID=A0AAU9EAN9_9BACT|nr:hypothetical protein FAK_12590 [Desulfoferula mesophilus]
MEIKIKGQKLVGISPVAAGMPHEELAKIQAGVNEIIAKQNVINLALKDHQKNQLKELLLDHIFLSMWLQNRMGPKSFKEGLDGLIKTGRAFSLAMDNLHADGWIEVERAVQEKNDIRGFVGADGLSMFLYNMQKLIGYVVDGAETVLDQIPKAQQGRPTGETTDRIQKKDAVSRLLRFYEGATGEKYRAGADKEWIECTGRGFLFIKECLLGLGYQHEPDKTLSDFIALTYVENKEKKP